MEWFFASQKVPRVTGDYEEFFVKYKGKRYVAFFGKNHVWQFKKNGAIPKDPLEIEWLDESEPEDHFPMGKLY